MLRLTYQQWANALTTYAKSEALAEELRYWQKTSSLDNLPVPVDFNRGPHTAENSRFLSVSLNQEETNRLLQQVPQAYRTQINDILLTALVQAIGDWTGKYSLCLSLEGHGRENIIEDIDLSRTVGWFTSIFPVHLILETSQDLGQSLKAIKEQLRAIPNRGIGYGILKYLTAKNDINQLSKPTSEPQISFNYLGQWDNSINQQGLFKFAQESVGLSTAPSNTLQHLIDINSQVVDGCLKSYWRYSSNHYQEETVQNVANSFISYLQKIISHCSDTQNFGYTPSDFPLAKLSQSTLDNVFGHQKGIEDVYPLAGMQSGLLFRALYDNSSEAYFIQNIFALRNRS